MAHVKAGSSNAAQKENVVGKRRGLKVNDGQYVNGGQILVRQTGVIYHPGQNTKLSRDHSVISRIAGLVKFSYLRRPNGLKTVINVMLAKAKVEPVKAEAKVEKPKAEKVLKKVVAKVEAPKKSSKTKATKATAKK